jgi:hypothetical protein
VRVVVFPGDKEQTMAESKELHLAELHAHAAYAHAAAAHVHSTGDHAAARELARKALDYSVEALKHTEGTPQNPPQSIHV